MWRRRFFAAGRRARRTLAGRAVERGMTRRYLPALLLIAVVLISSWGVLHGMSTATKSDAAVINIAGAQGMLSQRLSALTAALEAEPAAPQAREDLARSLQRMTAGHRHLTEGDKAPARGSKALAEHYFEGNQALAPRVEAFLDATRALLANPTDAPARAAMALAREEALGPLLRDLDQAAALLEAVAAGHIARSQLTHLGLVVLALALLAAAALFVFRPLSKRLGALAGDLATARIRARRAEAARQRFTAAISHEMRTPMNGVLGMLDMLAAGSLPPEQAKRVEISRSAAEHAVSILNDLLDAASLESGAFDLTLRPVPLRPQLDAALGIFGGRADEKGLALSLDIAGDLLPAVMADPQRLKQVLFNLVGNAVKFTATGQVTLRVRQPRPDIVRIDVADTGPGLDDAQQARLFERFVRVGPRGAPGAGGTGLGLAISRDLVEAMGGRIGVDSTPGEGSVFWFELDAAKAVDDVADETAAPTEPMRPLQTLVVDDNEVNRLVAGQLLASMGHEVRYANDGAEAVDAVANRAFDVVFMDSEMPRMNGLDATQAIVVHWPEHAQAIIGLTGHAASRDRAACLAAGMNDVLVKPVRLEELEAALARLR